MDWRWLSRLTLFVTPLVLLNGCATASRASAHRRQATLQESRTATALVEAAELTATLQAAGDDVVVLDVRGAEAYEAGHLPGAVRVDYGAWEDESLAADSGLEHADYWRKRIGALGVDANDLVLIYDGGKMTQAARIWFILQHFGVRDARVVNGGWPLIAETAATGRLTLSTAPAQPTPARFEPDKTAAGRIGAVTRAEVRAAIDAGTAQVLDARSADEYRGRDARGNPRAGHLPGALNVSHTQLLDDRNRLLPPPALAALLKEAGLEPGRPVITHCQGGGRAALAALAAARAGYGPVVNYYLSFGDWSRDASCPVVAP